MSFLDKLFKKQIEGKNAEEWYQLAARETEPEKKIEYLDNVINLKPDFAGAWNLKGLEYVSLKQYKEAIDCFDQALDIRPNYPEAQYNREDAENEMRKQEMGPIEA